MYCHFDKTYLFHIVYLNILFDYDAQYYDTILPCTVIVVMVTVFNSLKITPKRNQFMEFREAYKQLLTAQVHSRTSITKMSHYLNKLLVFSTSTLFRICNSLSLNLRYFLVSIRPAVQLLLYHTFYEVHKIKYRW